jgi:hypothetical protein
MYRPWRSLGLREVEAPTLSDIRLIDGGKVVIPKLRPLFPPRKFPGTLLCSRLSRPQGHNSAERIRKIEKKLTSSGTRTGDLPACSIVPLPLGQGIKCWIHLSYTFSMKLWHTQEYDIWQPFLSGGADYHKFYCTSEQFPFAYFSFNGIILPEAKSESADTWCRPFPVFSRKMIWHDRDQCKEGWCFIVTPK